jgi:hypothetical protein
MNNAMSNVTAENLAVEIVRVSTLHTLSEAARSESLSDVLGVHESVLRARLGSWDSETEHHAIRMLGRAIEDALDDDATESSLIKYLREVVS